MIDPAEAFNEDTLPKFKKPVISKHQLTQQQLATDASIQFKRQQQQSLLFEDFSTENVETSAPIIDKI